MNTELEAILEAMKQERISRETDIEYLRRVRPTWDDDRRYATIFLCATHTQSLRETIKEIEE